MPIRSIIVKLPYFLMLLWLNSWSMMNASITNVHLDASPASPQLLGTAIQLTAAATDSDPGPLSYKWEVKYPGDPSFKLMRDFNQLKTFHWASNYTEGTYLLRLTVRDFLARTSAQKVIPFVAQPLVTTGQAVAVATANPLVALFSGPNCPAGSSMAVVFQLPGSGRQTVTDYRPCHIGSQNFYIGGMLADQTYTMFAQVDTGGTITRGNLVSFKTGTIPTSLQFPAFSIPVPPGTDADATSDVILSGYTADPNFPFATDLNANIIWYYASALQLTRPVAGGTFLSIPNGPGTGTGVWGPGIMRQQVLREFDLAGYIVRETNSDRVHEQLQALGMTDPMGRFNHEALRLSNGQTLVVGDVQRIYAAGTQGSTAPIDIIGDVIILLDQNFQVLWYWNAFDHACSGGGCLDINRPGNNTCTSNPETGKTQGGCPPVLLSSPANDWLHINSLQYFPSDGDLLASVRNQDWIAKIDYQNGGGTGDVLWRLGLDGDFVLAGSTGEPFPWFSGQHNPAFINQDQKTLVVFDNGNTRHARFGGHSRGQVWNIDQVNLTASLLLNADLGGYSPALGSAQVLENGNYMFYSGDLPVKGETTAEVESTEYSPTGTVEYEFAATGPARAYRGWRLPSLYRSSQNGSGGPE